MNPKRPRYGLGGRRSMVDGAGTKIRPQAAEFFAEEPSMTTPLSGVHVVDLTHVLRIGHAVTDSHGARLSRMTQRNPTWLVEVSTGSAWRAAGR